MATILIKDALDEKGKAAIVEAAKKNFGKLTKEDLWGSRDLAYPILHQDKAYYAHFEFESEPDKILAFDRSLKLNEDVVRYLIVRTKVKKVSAKSSSIARNKKAKTETENAEAAKGE